VSLHRAPTPHRAAGVLPRPVEATRHDELDEPGGDVGPDFAAVHRSPQFGDVRRRLRRFVFTMTVVFLAWYLLFILLSAFAPGLMSVPVLGAINLGLLLGLSQFATTLLIVAAYRHFARTRIDPQVRAIRRAYER
jgi:uncharacterized membrane protein (DUF485 family)